MKLNTRIKALFITILLLTSMVLSTSCYPGYRGEHPELCSAAWANLISADGMWADGCELLLDSSMVILEEDDMGRVLFSYFEGYSSLMNLLIIQKTDGGNVYFYPDDCYISFTVTDEQFVGWRCYYPSDDEVKGIISSDISPEKIEELKVKNDWGLPIDETKCESTEITKKKPEGKLKIGDSDFERIAEEYYSYTGRYVNPRNVSHVTTTSFITSDNYGRELHIVHTKITDYYDKSEVTYYYSLLMVIMPDKSCDVSTILVIEDSANSQEQIRQLKIDNGWNTPI